MDHEDFVKWQLYFEKRPYQWRDDDRAAKLLAAQGVKAKPEQIFPSLKALKGTAAVAKDGQLDESFRGSFLFNKLLGARGGDKVLT